MHVETMEVHSRRCIGLSTCAGWCVTADGGCRGGLQACQLKVKKTNPRQYIAKMTNVPGMEVWFQRASDVVRRLRAGDVDLGILGGDMFEEFGEVCVTQILLPPAGSHLPPSQHRPIK
jgi:hypothetical protein